MLVFLVVRIIIFFFLAVEPTIYVQCESQTIRIDMLSSSTTARTSLESTVVLSRDFDGNTSNVDMYRRSLLSSQLS